MRDKYSGTCTGTCAGQLIKNVRAAIVAWATELPRLTLGAAFCHVLSAVRTTLDGRPNFPKPGCRRLLHRRHVTRVRLAATLPAHAMLRNSYGLARTLYYPPRWTSTTCSRALATLVRCPVNCGMIGSCLGVIQACGVGALHAIVDSKTRIAIASSSMNPY